MDTEKSGKDSKRDGENKSDPIKDYYQKFSQNRQLPKYFCGSSVSYLPEVADLNDDDRTLNPEIIITEVKETKPSEAGGDRSKNASPTSSVASNKKLEWDNGADIGYDNCNKNILHKSLSLPILTNPDGDSNKNEKSHSNSGSNEREINIDKASIRNISILHPSSHCSSSSNYIDNSVIKIAQSTSSVSNNNLPDVVNSSSSSSEGNISNGASKKLIETSSTSSSEKERILNFKATLSYLKRKIGVPDAESTPKDAESNKDIIPPMYSATPVVKKPDRPHKVLSENFSEISVKSSKKSEHYQEQSNLKSASSVHISSSCENLSQYVKKKLRKSNSQTDIPHYQRFKPRKVVNLCKTKPVIVECIDTKKPSGNKKIQTSLSAKKENKCTQTDEVDHDTIVNLLQNTTDFENYQNIIYIELSDSNERSDSNMRSSITQTDGTGFNSGSFEYISGGNFNKKQLIDNKNNISSVKNTGRNKDIEMFSDCNTRQTGTLKRSNPKQDLTKVNSSSTSKDSSSRNVPLGDLISAHSSNRLLTDIDKSITLLQKLMKSQKYDPSTKRRYIKKIVQKIADSKFLEESSTSSELFRPKKSFIDYSGVKINDGDVKASTSSSNNGKKSPEKCKLESNIPWYPAKTTKQTETQKTSRKQKKLQIQTHSEEILPELKDKYKILLKQTEGENSAASHERVIPTESSEEHFKNPHLALVNKRFTSNYKKVRSESSNITSTSAGGDSHHNNQYDGSLEKQYLTSSSSGQVSQNWRQDKTMSEKLLEQRKALALAQGDHLVQYAKNERKHQISWINNEIDHLSKLKYLLEKRPKGTIKNDGLFGEGKYDNMKSIKKTTTVYMVSENYGGKMSGNTSRYCTADNSGSCSTKSGRNFVIQTELTDTISSDEIKFRLSDNNGERNYTCREVLPKCPKQKQPAKLTGDIKVSTTDNTTNITVKAKRAGSGQASNQHKRGSGVYQYSTFPRSATESKFSNSNIEARTKPSCPSEASVIKPACSCKSSRSDIEYIPCRKLSKSKPQVVCTGIRRAAHRNSCQAEDNPCCCKNNLASAEVQCNCCVRLPSSNKKCYCCKRDFVPCGDNNTVRKDDEKVQCACCNKKMASSKCQCLTKDVNPCEGKNTYQEGAEKVQCTCCNKKMVSCKCQCLEKDNACEDKTIDDQSNKQIRCNCCRKQSGIEKKCCCTRRGAADQNEAKVQTLTEQVQCYCCDEDKKNSEKTQCTCSKQSSSDKKCQCQSKREVSSEDKKVGGQDGEFHCNCCKKHPLPGEFNRDQNTGTQSKCKCDEAVQCNCGKADCKCSESIQTTPFAKDQDQQCVCGLQECKCNAKVQTDQSQQDRNSQIECLCNSEELQTAVCESKPKSEQTVYPCVDEKVQSICKCCSVTMQTKSCAQQDEKQQTNCCLQDANVQAECKCSETDAQCECKCYGKSSVEKLDYATNYSRARAANYSLAQDGIETLETESSETESSESLVECICCKQKRASKYAALKDKLDAAQPLCHPCNQQNRGMPWSHFGSPQHVCRCYTMVQTTTFNEIKRTINELNCLEQVDQYCTCSDMRNKRSVKYCKYCKYKLEAVDTNKNGMAYMVTFDYEKPKKKRHKRKEEPQLEEIKIRIPHHKKKHKDKENEKLKGRLMGGSDDFSTSEGTSCIRNRGLQDYLKMNRPNFIENLEKRRRAVIDCKSQREENNELKKLLYLKDQQQPTVQLANPKITRYFTPKEMKEITERNYKKLPEVQKKLKENRDNQLKQANRLITGQFNEKLRTQVLRGKRSLPTDVNVVTLVCRNAR